MASYRARSLETRFERRWYVHPSRRAQILNVNQEHDINAFTKQPHSAQYRKILEARKKLPVFAQMDDFFKMVSASPRAPVRRG
jgi:HrpA-like RNA helicase